MARGIFVKPKIVSIKEEVMLLSEIYQKGAEILEGKKLGFNLRGVETEFVLRKWLFLTR